MFNIVGEAQARTLGIVLNIYCDDETSPEVHYKEFNANTDKKQMVSLSIISENKDSKDK